MPVECGNQCISQVPGKLLGAAEAELGLSGHIPAVATSTQIIERVAVHLAASVETEEREIIQLIILCLIVIDDQ